MPGPLPGSLVRMANWAEPAPAVAEGPLTLRPLVLAGVEGFLAEAAVVAALRSPQAQQQQAAQVAMAL